MKHFLSKAAMLVLSSMVLLASCKKDKDDDPSPTPAPPPPPPPPAWDISGWFNTAGWGNMLMDKWQDAGIDGSIFDLGVPNVLPAGGSALLSGADFTGLPSFFEPVSFRGAFGTEDWTQGWLDWNSALTTYPSLPIVEVNGSLTGNINWTADNIYRLNGFVRVQDGGVLNIAPGTIIFGDFESKGTLIIQRGGTINAIGNASNPIIMTSEKAPGFRQPGDWGGLVMCGRARNNVAGGEAELEGGYGAFHGGNDDNDNSGTVSFVQINFAGIPINPNEEVNSLTMGSLGRGTTIDHVLCAYGLDDAFEWFGGSVDGKYLVAYRGLDDDFDCDLGWSGNVQFGLGIRGASLADQSGSNGFEVDNDGSGSGNQPFTSGTFSNITIIGPKKTRETPISLQFQHCAQLRRNSRLNIHNTFMTGYPDGLFLQGSGVVANATNNDMRIRNVILAGVEHWGGNGWGSAGTVFPDAPANGNQHPNNPRGRALKTDQ